MEKDTSLLPEKLIGAWRRTGLIIDGQRRVDYCDVLWLQGEQWFADIRLRLNDQDPQPGDGVAVDFATEGAFAGIARWSEPTMSWEHILDVRDEPPTDVSPVKWQNGGIIEGGTMNWQGRQVPWAEEWVRLVDSSVEPVVTLADRYIHITVGDYAIEIKDERPQGTFTATRYALVDGTWIKVGTVSS